MKRYIPWLGLGLLAAALGGSTFACSSDSGGGSGGSGATASGGVGGGPVGGAGGAVGGAGGSGATGGGGTGGTAQTKLGAKCTKDAECGAGLTCLLASGTELDGEGAPKGLCTAECSADPSVCGQFASNAVCLNYDTGKGYCLEGCSFGPSGLQAFDSKKCHGRPEIACSGLLGSTAGSDCGPPNYDCPKGEACGNDNKCHPLIPACVPRCNADADCGTGLKCNPKSGLCTAGAITGKKLGEACTVNEDAGTNDCEGVCINFGDDLRSCGSACTIGANPSCGWSGSGPAPSFCLYATSVVADNGGPGLGDLGLCIQFCDCNADCKTPGLVCSDFGTSSDATSIKNFLKRKGACFNPKNSQDGAINPGIPSCGTDAGTGGTSGTGGAAGSGGASDASTD